MWKDIVSIIDSLIELAREKASRKFVAAVVCVAGILYFGYLGLISPLVAVSISAGVTVVYILTQGMIDYWNGD